VSDYPVIEALATLAVWVLDGILWVLDFFHVK
jgi:hypothetical protein